MSNHYFQFKQFTIQQDRCAMKVSTDACIQGAWTPVNESVKHVLDIGTGTGLLSLMLAQRNADITIDAIELDEAAAQQAKENVEASPWANRIQVIQADATTYSFNKQYDMVICNPPFFNNSLLGPNAERNNVRHTLTLSYTALFNIIKKTLSPSGYASVLLPAAEHEVWAGIIQEQGWCFSEMLSVYPKKDVPYNRVVSICTPQAASVKMHTLQIYEGGTYTAAFAELMQPYYLKL